MKAELAVNRTAIVHVGKTFEVGQQTGPITAPKHRPAGRASFTVFAGHLVGDDEEALAVIVLPGRGPTVCDRPVHESVKDLVDEAALVQSVHLQLVLRVRGDFHSQEVLHEEGVGAFGPD